jgi:flagellar basal body-associated protein FliL
LASVKTLLIVLFVTVAAIALACAFLFLRKAQNARLETEQTKAELEPLRRMPMFAMPKRLPRSCMPKLVI